MRRQNLLYSGLGIKLLRTTLSRLVVQSHAFLLMCTLQWLFRTIAVCWNDRLTLSPRPAPTTSETLASSGGTSTLQNSCAGNHHLDYADVLLRGFPSSLLNRLLRLRHRAGGLVSGTARGIQLPSYWCSPWHCTNIHLCDLVQRQQSTRTLLSNKVTLGHRQPPRLITLS